jgi:hypothetical protein
MKPLTAAAHFWVAGTHRVDASLARKNDRVAEAKQRPLDLDEGIYVVRCGSTAAPFAGKRDRATHGRMALCSEVSFHEVTDEATVRPHDILKPERSDATLPTRDRPQALVDAALPFIDGLPSLWERLAQR